MKLELLIDEQAKREGRSKNEMVIHLIARGLHQSNFLIDHYCNSFDDDQGNKR